LLEAAFGDAQRTDQKPTFTCELLVTGVRHAEETDPGAMDRDTLSS